LKLLSKYFGLWIPIWRIIAVLFFLFPEALVAQENKIIGSEFQMKTGTFGDYLKKNLQFTWKSSAYDIEGKVFVEFRLDSLGNVCSTRLLKGIGSDMDSSVVDLVKRTSGFWDLDRMKFFNHSKPLICRVFIETPFHLVRTSEDPWIRHLEPNGEEGFLIKPLTKYFNLNKRPLNFEINVWINEYCQIQKILIHPEVNNEIHEVVLSEFKRVSSRVEIHDDHLRLFDWWPPGHITVYVSSDKWRQKPVSKIVEYNEELRPPFLIPYRYYGIDN